MQVQYKRPDGSFVAIVNGWPYHVVQGDPLFAAAQAAGGNAPLEPVPTAPTEAETLAQWRATAKVSRFQAFAALDAAGLLGQATALVTAQGGVAKLAWDNAIEFRRSSPTINGLASAMGLTDEALDALFLAAAEIEA